MPSESAVKTDVQNVTKFYDQLRLFSAVNSGINNQNGTALTNLVAAQGVCNAAFAGDFVSQKNGAIAGSRASVAAVLAGDIGNTGRWVLRDWAQYLNVPETDSLGILKRVYDDFQANNKRVASRGFTFGSPAAGTNTGNGVVFRLNVDENGYVLENQTADGKTAKCTQDGTSGTEVWEELFEIRGQSRAIDTLAITGSGNKANIAALSAKTSAALLRNPSFSQATPTGPANINAGGLTNWTLSPDADGTSKYSTIGGTGVSGYYRGFPGDSTPLALRINTTGTVTISQNLETNRSRFVRTIPYLVQVAWRRKSSATGTLTMALGNANTSVDISTGTNDVWNTLRFTGTKCWFKNMDTSGLTFTLSTSTLATGQLDLDDVLICPMSSFDGSWYAFVGTPATGTPAQFLLDDSFTWTDTELGETYGIIQKIFLWRGFGVYLPAIPQAPTGAPTATLSATAGVVTTGTHLLAYSYVDVNGIESGLSPASGTVTGDGAHKVDLTGITVGPATTASRWVYMTKAGTSTPYFRAVQINDNSTTTQTGASGINVADGSLVTQATTVVANAANAISLADPT